MLAMRAPRPKCSTGRIMRWPLHAVVSIRRPESAAAGRLDDEHVAGSHTDLECGAEFLARPVGALDPVAASSARLPSTDAERRDAPVIGQHDRGHRLQEAHPPLPAVAASVASRAAAAAPD